MPSVARPPLGSMSSIMRVNLCLLMDGSGFAKNEGLRADRLPFFLNKWQVEEIPPLPGWESVRILSYFLARPPMLMNKDWSHYFHSVKSQQITQPTICNHGA